MTGVLNAMVGQGSGSRYSVTIGNFITVAFGYNQPGGHGAITSTSFRGATIINVSHRTDGGGQFSVTLDGVRAQSFFGGIEAQTTAGGIVTLLTSAAIYSNDGTWTFWSWPSTTIWTSTSPSPRLIRIF